MSKIYWLKIKGVLIFLMIALFFIVGLGLIGNSYRLIFSGSVLTSLMFLVGGLLSLAISFKMYDLRAT